MNSLFPTGVYKTNIYIGEKEKNFIKNLEYYRIHLNNGDSSVNTRVLHEPELKKLSDEIQKHADNFFKKVLCVKDDVTLEIQNSWVMKHHKGDYAQKHRHANSLFSCALYLNVDKNSGKIYFERPQQTINEMFLFEYTDYNYYNSMTWYFEPEVGDLFIFPSDLYHFTSTNDSNIDRYCLALNLFPKGNVTSTKISELTLK